MSTKPTILVVNDSVLVLSWVTYALRSAFDVKTRSDAIGTGAAIIRLRPQLVLIDAQMPLLDGEEVVESIQRSAAGHGVSILLFAALPLSELAAKAAGCGADGYIQRTTDPTEFCRAVEAYFEPAVEARTTDATPPTAPQPRFISPHQVVLADEQALNADELALFGPHVSPPKRVSSLSDLFTVLRLSRPGLAVFGRDMVDGTVIEACRFIRANPAMRQVSVLFVGEEGDVIRARAIEAAGANVCLVRPFAPGVLPEAVATLLEVAARREARFLVRLRANAADPGAGIFAYSQNISVTGIRLETNDPLAVGSTHHLNFFMPDGRTEVSCAGEIVRFHDRLGDRRSYGVKLVDLLPGYRQAIARFVQRAVAC